MNKKGKDLSISTIILIIFGFCILVILTFGYITGWIFFKELINSSTNYNITISYCNKQTKLYFNFTKIEEIESVEKDLRNNCGDDSIYLKYNIEIPADINNLCKKILSRLEGLLSSYTNEKENFYNGEGDYFNVCEEKGVQEIYIKDDSNACVLADKNTKGTCGYDNYKNISSKDLTKEWLDENCECLECSKGVYYQELKKCSSSTYNVDYNINPPIYSCSKYYCFNKYEVEVLK